MEVPFIEDQLPSKFTFHEGHKYFLTGTLSTLAVTLLKTEVLHGLYKGGQDYGLILRAEREVLEDIKLRVNVRNSV